VALQGPGYLAATLLDLVSGSILFSMAILLLFVLLRLLLRKDALAMAAVALVACIPSVLGAWDAAWAAAILGVVWAVTWILLLLRFGLLAAIVALFANDLLQSLPLTTDLTSWTAAPTLVGVALAGSLATFALRNAIGGTGFRRALAVEAASRP
jgi:hypothetical protein